MKFCILSNFLALCTASADDIYSKSSRKLLEKGSKYESSVPDQNNYHGKEKNHSRFASTPKKIGILAAGSVLSCCVFLCPCFNRKRKETSDAALTKDQSTSEFMSFSYIVSDHFDDLIFNNFQLL